MFLVDDFGRERVSPDQLLNRFITPMEHQFDYFTLSTGQKIQVPLRQVLIIATNLSLGHGDGPGVPPPDGLPALPGGADPGAVPQIFPAYAERHGAAVAPAVLDGLLERYRAQDRRAAGVRAARPDRAGPRHLPVPRAAAGLSRKVLDLAWTGYFGTAPPADLRDRGKGTSTICCWMSDRTLAGGESTRSLTILHCRRSTTPHASCSALDISVAVVKLVDQNGPLRG